MQLSGQWTFENKRSVQRSYSTENCTHYVIVLVNKLKANPLWSKESKCYGWSDRVFVGAAMAISYTATFIYRYESLYTDTGYTQNHTHVAVRQQQTNSCMQ